MDGEYDLYVDDGADALSNAEGMQIIATRRRELLEQYAFTVSQARALSCWDIVSKEIGTIVAHGLFEASFFLWCHA
jgi:hypothetical protein